MEKNGRKFFSCRFFSRTKGTLRLNKQLRLLVASELLFILALGCLRAAFHFGSCLPPSSFSFRLLVASESLFILALICLRSAFHFGSCLPQSCFSFWLLFASGLLLIFAYRFAYFPTMAAVSWAIISSSSVGMTTTFTLESSPEITISSPRVLLAASLKVTPR